MSRDESSAPVSVDSADFIVDEEWANLFVGLTPRFVLGQRMSADLREGPVTLSDLGVKPRQPYLVNHNGKNYVSIFGDTVVLNDDIVDHVLMIIGPNKVVPVPPSDVYYLWCSLALPKGYSWRGCAGRTRFSVSRIMRRYSNFAD